MYWDLNSMGIREDNIKGSVQKSHERQLPMIKNVDDDDNDVLPSEVAASDVRLT